MSNYTIFADSACDLSADILKEWQVKHASLSFTFDDEEKEYLNDEMLPDEFYANIRLGKTARTSAINIATFKDLFLSDLKAGNDVLYLGFSGGLSTTCNSARIAAEELAEEFTDRKILVVDTLSASAGYGLLLYLAVCKRDEGATIEEVAKFVDEKRFNLCHWFTVDDLNHLKRGGRISPTVAFIGTVMGIKPVLHMDDEGHLINMFKVRGRKAAIKALADKFGELAVDNTEGPVYISHGDCIDDANELAHIIEEEYKVKTDIITYVGPVIGAHSGPGTLALFFVGKER